MKYKMLPLLALMAIMSCAKQKTTTTTTVPKTDPDPVSTGGTATGGTTTGGTTTSGTTTSGTTTSGTTTSGTNSGSCNGDESDGTGTGSAIRIFKATLGGQGSHTDPRQQDWRPGRTSGVPEWIPSIQEAALLFGTDSRLKVRFKVLPQWFPSAGVMGCDGRVTGMTADPYPYTKLKVRLALRDVIKTGDSYSLAPNSYQDIVTVPVSVNSCSPVYDFSSKRNTSAYGTVVEIRDVMSDNECQANGLQCPAEKLVRKQSCWKVVLEVATDLTKDLQ